MLFLELQNKLQIDAAPNTTLAGQISGEIRRSRKLQTQVGLVGQNAEAAASDLGSRVAVVRDVLRQTATKLTSAEVKASQALTNSVAVSADLTQTKRSMSDKIAGLSDMVQSTVLAVRSVETDGQRQENQLRGHLATHDDSILRFSEALSGNIKLYAEVIAADLSAAALNAAAANTFTRDLTVSLVSEMGEGETTVRYVHPWALLPPIITAEAVADPDITAPTVKDHNDPLATPQFNAGVLQLVVIFDTDAGVTKTYAAEDELTVTVKVSATNVLLGWSVSEFTMTYTVVA